MTNVICRLLGLDEFFTKGNCTTSQIKLTIALLRKTIRVFCSYCNQFYVCYRNREINLFVKISTATISDQMKTISVVRRNIEKI